MSEKLITLTRYAYAEEAYILMKKLADEGIESYIGDENLISAHPFLSNAVGGVKVNIKETDLDAALLVLETIKGEGELPNIDETWNIHYAKTDSFCPKCDLRTVYKNKMSFLHKVLAVIFFPIYLLYAFRSQKYYCAHCGYEWEQ